MNRLIHPDIWRPVDVDELEGNALTAVRSTMHCSIIAGPGAGKTELLAQRACYLLQTGLCPTPRRILAISFKRDAAKNLRERVRQRCHPEHSARFDSFTFDAFAKGLLDRFLGAIPANWRPTRDYEIVFPNYRTIPDFFATLGSPPSKIATMADLQAILHNTFEKERILGTPLPTIGINVRDAASWATHIWWQRSLSGGAKSRITFPMIGRLVELMLRANPLICVAIRATYSHVFMDEFQDTTHVQYDLVKTAFGGSNTVLTAVGDNKQQIMRWAMALENPFGCFENDFGAVRLPPLTRNYRSSPALVRMQHHIAVAVDPTATVTISMLNEMGLDDACLILEFDTPEAEAKYLAEEISTGMKKYELKPRDFALLVRQKPSDYERLLIGALGILGIKARAEIELQDILAERLTGIMIRFLRFGARSKAGNYWTECYRISALIGGIDPENENGSRFLHEKLSDFHRALHKQMKCLPDSTDQTAHLLHNIVDFIGRENIKLIYPEYRQGKWFDAMLENVAKFLAPRCQTLATWDAVLDDFEGIDSIPIMTIHKSKGLEYHTVIFVGLDDSAWWSFRTQPEESRSAFFVAFSRAKHRILFTYCEQRGGRSEISSLYEILRSAGVQTQSINPMT